MKRAQFRAAFGDAIGYVLSLVRRLPPVERDRAVDRELVDVNQDLVAAADALTNVQHRLVLLAFATRVEVNVASHGSLAEGADLEKTLEACGKRVAVGQLVEDAARVGELFGNPALRRRRVPVLEPLIGVDDQLAEVLVGDRMLLRVRRFKNRHGIGDMSRSVFPNNKE